MPLARTRASGALLPRTRKPSAEPEPGAATVSAARPSPARQGRTYDYAYACLPASRCEAGAVRAFAPLPPRHPGPRFQPLPRVRGAGGRPVRWARFTCSRQVAVRNFRARESAHAAHPPCRVARPAHARPIACRDSQRSEAALCSTSRDAPRPARACATATHRRKSRLRNP